MKRPAAEEFPPEALLFRLQIDLAPSPLLKGAVVEFFGYNVVDQLLVEPAYTTKGDEGYGGYGWEVRPEHLKPLTVAAREFLDSMKIYVVLDSL